MAKDKKREKLKKKQICKWEISKRARTRDLWSARFDRIDGGGGRAVLQHDAELGEHLVQPLEGGQEGFLVGDVLAGRRAGDLAVQVEHNVVLLHGGKSVLEGLDKVACHSRV